MQYLPKFKVSTKKFNNNNESDKRYRIPKKILCTPTQGQIGLPGHQDIPGEPLPIGSLR